MKKIIFGIFAHPDDEAFGPAGALLQDTRAGSDLHLISLTAGDAGANPDNVENLSEARLKEWQRSGELLGAKSMHFLGYKDSKLCNHSLVEIAEHLTRIVSEAIQTAPNDATIEFMAFDFNGLSGHIDHIVASRAACLAFYKLKQNNARMTRIRLACLPANLYPEDNIDWVFRDKGRTEAEVDEIIDARDLRDDIIAIMHAHTSQRDDCERYLKDQGDQLGLNYFIVKS